MQKTPPKPRARKSATGDVAEARGQGGETHQRASGRDDVLTTNQGTPIADNQNSLKQGPRGPSLLEDFILRQKITHFDHERIPERIVHARGSGAHGTPASRRCGRAPRASPITTARHGCSSTRCRRRSNVTS